VQDDPINNDDPTGCRYTHDCADNIRYIVGVVGIVWAFGGLAIGLIAPWALAGVGLALSAAEAGAIGGIIGGAWGAIGAIGTVSAVYIAPDVANCP
jgi:hypothetical protein